MKKAQFVKSWDDVPVIFDLAYASVLVGMGPERLRQLSKLGQFPARKFGGGNKATWRIDRGDFIKWWDSRIQKGS